MKKRSMTISKAKTSKKILEINGMDDYKLFSNIENAQLKTFQAIAKIIGMEYEIRPSYFPNNVSIFVPAEYFDTPGGMISKCLETNVEFARRYREHLMKKGYDVEPLLGKAIYKGCEKDYGLRRTADE